MEVVAILMSLAGMGVAVVLALKDERRSQAQTAECLAQSRYARFRHGPGT